MEPKQPQIVGFPARSCAEIMHDLEKHTSSGDREEADPHEQRHRNIFHRSPERGHRRVA